MLDRHDIRITLGITLGSTLDGPVGRRDGFSADTPPWTAPSVSRPDPVPARISPRHFLPERNRCHGRKTSAAEFQAVQSRLLHRRDDRGASDPELDCRAQHRQPAVQRIPAVARSTQDRRSGCARQHDPGQVHRAAQRRQGILHDQPGRPAVCRRAREAWRQIRRSTGKQLADDAAVLDRSGTRLLRALDVSLPRRWPTSRDSAE